ncbi:MAG: hypothetical protein QG570_377, partial [Patescibacteria group bacterium]|nr:hypothetical protein [Patescibacteria group bacterium]
INTASEMVKDLLWYFKCDDIGDPVIRNLVEEAAENIQE